MWVVKDREKNGVDHEAKQAESEKGEAPHLPGRKLVQEGAENKRKATEEEDDGRVEDE
jgi:hypothetical protein